MSEYTAKIIHMNDRQNDREGNVCYMDNIAIYKGGTVIEYIDVLSASSALERDDAVAKAIGTYDFNWVFD